MGKPSHQCHEIPICCISVLFKGLSFHAARLLRLVFGYWDVGVQTSVVLE